MIKVGCCGFPRRKTEYAEHFPVVEVQQTFYQPPRLRTAQRWREQVPPTFEFTLKVWQLITHEPRSPTYRRLREPIPEEHKDRYGAFRPTAEVYAAWQRTREIAEALQARLVLFQCPASFTPTDEHIANLRAFFQSVDRAGLIFAWEPRGAWPEEMVGALCRELDLIHAVDPFQQWPVTPHLAYFRLHGRTGYRYRYTDEDLMCLLEWCRRFDEVYCLFNNVSMWEDGLRMLNNVARPFRRASHVAHEGTDPIGKSAP
ncbi:MAG: DUF72 domain-containing protein, partial [Anaerolineae bacterium]|nr:DUF72 domain-containing protein [Anaerolineae bacterium]